MATNDPCCTIHPYFKIAPGKMDEFNILCEQMMDKVSHESNCLYYGFSFFGDEAHCREGYVDAEAMLLHNENVAELFEQVQKIAKVTRLEVHGPDTELEKLRKPLAKLNPLFFTLKYGFRR